MNIILLILSSFILSSQSLPLSTRSRWIIDESSGVRVKLACVNWVGHLEPMLPEGLDKQPVSRIVAHVKSMGFNCVRLTYATHMYTRYANVRVAQSLRNLGLTGALQGLARNNPGLSGVTVVEAQRAVVAELVRKGLMVVLDNHVSKPKWCCNSNDGNGFFGDMFFDPEEWKHGLNIVATTYKDTPQVVGMSLRNELRGRRQNVKAWYTYMEAGATTIHQANPNLLIIVSGLNFDLNLGFLKSGRLNLNFTNKLVYEMHRYAFSWASQFWSNGDACGKALQQIHEEGGFLVEGGNAVPLFVTEFGVNQKQLGRAEASFLGCFLGFLGRTDLDWSVWALQGSYYVKDGVTGSEETYGMLSYDWSSIRNPGFYYRLRRLIKKKLN